MNYINFRLLLDATVIQSIWKIIRLIFKHEIASQQSTRNTLMSLKRQNYNYVAVVKSNNKKTWTASVNHFLQANIVIR